MGEKVYKPVVKDGDHLIRSKDNPERVRGLTRDENNKNPDIIEWEEYDIEDLTKSSTTYYPTEKQHIQLTPEQEEAAQMIGEALGAAFVAISKSIYHNVISPWWKNRAWPWLKEKGQNVFDKKKEKKIETPKVSNSYSSLEKQFSEISSQIDKSFDDIYFSMDEKELKEHFMRLVYHMLGVVNEIRVISNARICKECDSEKKCIEKQKEAEKFLTERVALNFDQLLSNKKIQLDLETSKELFVLVGGGVYLNGEYLPVQPTKIYEALIAIK